MGNVQAELVHQRPVSYRGFIQRVHLQCLAHGFSPFGVPGVVDALFAGVDTLAGGFIVLWGRARGSRAGRWQPSADGHRALHHGAEGVDACFVRQQAASLGFLVVLETRGRPLGSFPSFSFLRLGDENLLAILREGDLGMRRGVRILAAHWNQRAVHPAVFRRGRGAVVGHSCVREHHGHDEIRRLGCLAVERPVPVHRLRDRVMGSDALQLAHLRRRRPRLGGDLGGEIRHREILLSVRPTARPILRTVELELARLREK